MSSRNSSRPVSVKIPPPASDSPSWVRVGIVAAVGFGIGVVWPRVAGVRLGPSAPGAAAAESANEPAPPPLPISSAKSLAVSSPIPPSATSMVAPIAPGGKVTEIAVKRGVILSCKASDGTTSKGKDCGSLAFDEMATSKIRMLSTCPQASGLSGKLSIIFNLDFPKAAYTITFGKSSEVGNQEALGRCLQKSFEQVKWKNLPHEFDKYAVAYNALFSTGDSPARDVAPVAASASGATRTTAKPAGPSKAGGGDEIEWDTALVREAPTTGKVIARLTRGTKVQAGESKGGWIAIHFGPDGSTEGWVYRGALGK